MKKSILMLLSIVAFTLITCQKEDTMVFNEIEPSLMESLALPDDVLENVAYGPERFIRTKGQPNVYEVSLSSIDFECILPQYVLTVINGEEDGSFRITSGRVYLDGEMIFGPSNFKKKVYQLEQAVELTESSMLHVELASKPGSYIHMYITGEYNEECNQDDPILWNKLGSDAEVLNSEVGAALSIIGTPTYAPAVFGNGVHCPDTENLVTVPVSEFDIEKGTFEMWLYFNDNTAGTKPMIYENGQSGAVFGEEIHLSHRPKDGYTWSLQFGPAINTDPINLSTTDGRSFNAGESVHIALVWDKDGIDGSVNTVRVYENGNIVLTYNEWNGGTLVGDVRLGNGWGFTSAFQGQIDNLKIYDYAKTDFSDRFTE